MPASTLAVLVPTRWLGHLLLWNVSLHGLMCSCAWWQNHVWVAQAFKWTNNLVASNLAGVIALVFGAIIWITSTYYVRKHFYKVRHAMRYTQVACVAVHPPVNSERTSGGQRWSAEEMQMPGQCIGAHGQLMGKLRKTIYACLIYRQTAGHRCRRLGTKAWA